MIACQKFVLRGLGSSVSPWGAGHDRGSKRSQPCLPSFPTLVPKCRSSHRESQAWGWNMLLAGARVDFEGGTSSFVNRSPVMCCKVLPREGAAGRVLAMCDRLRWRLLLPGLQLLSATHRQAKQKGK